MLNPNACTFCTLKDNKIDQLNQKIMNLESVKPKKPELTPEQKEAKKARQELNKKMKAEKLAIEHAKELELSKLADENRTLKNQFLVKFGVEI